MSCDENRKLMEELAIEEYPAALREHLAGCSACRAYSWQWRLVQAGFRQLGAEVAPEPSLGFTARLLRRLAEANDRRSKRDQFLEAVGRRFAYGGVLLALLLLLVLSVPPTGPVRVSSSTETVGAPVELAVANGDPFQIEDSQLGRDLIPPEFVGNSERGRK